MREHGVIQIWRSRLLKHVSTKPDARLLALLFLIAAFALGARPAYHLARGYVLQWRAAQLWQQSPDHAKLESGDPIAWLRAPRARIDTLVLFDGSLDNLSRFPCLSIHGARPAEKGLAIIQAHRNTHFRHLGKLRPGDPLFLQTRRGRWLTYRVTNTEVLSPEEMETRLRRPSDRQALALATCFPFRYTGPAPSRYLVWLAPVQPPGTPAQTAAQAVAKPVHQREGCRFEKDAGWFLTDIGRGSGL